MTDVTRILSMIESGDQEASEKLLPLVYEELRKLAAAKMAMENPGQTLQATALVHEAYLRLVGPNYEPRWDSRGHFFAAAAEAMRRILIDRARQKNSARGGGDHIQISIDHVDVASATDSVDVLAIDDVLTEFEAIDPVKANLVKLRYFVGLTIPQAAESLGISSSTADRYWAYARAWLHARLKKTE